MTSPHHDAANRCVFQPHTVATSTLSVQCTRNWNMTTSLARAALKGAVARNLIQPHPKGGLRICAPDMPVLLGEGTFSKANTHTLVQPDGSQVWVWTKHASARPQTPTIMLSWPDDEGHHQFYPEMLTCESFAGSPLELAKMFTTTPWRSALHSPLARTTYDRHAAAQDPNAYLPYWLGAALHDSTPPAVPQAASSLWAWIERVVLAGLSSLAMPAPWNTTVGLSPPQETNGLYAWDHDNLLAWDSLDVSDEDNEAAEDRLEAIQRMVHTALHDPRCPLQPIHAAGDPNKAWSRALPLLFQGTYTRLSAHHKIQAAQEWQWARQHALADLDALYRQAHVET